MNIISNNCVGGFLYNIRKEEYKNPFIWMRITGESLKQLVLNYDKINFNNYELTKDKNWNFSIIVDNIVQIHYSHYKFDAKCNKPIKVNNEIKYNKIWEYIVAKYEERLKKMTETPIFVLDVWYGMYNDQPNEFNENSTKDFLCDLLTHEFKYKTIIIHPYNDLTTTKQNVYLIYDKVIEGQWSDTIGVSNRHFKEIMKIAEEI
jgi:uncharacterized protein (DUF1919 family)